MSDKYPAEKWTIFQTFCFFLSFKTTILFSFFQDYNLWNAHDDLYHMIIMTFGHCTRNASKYIWTLDNSKFNFLTLSKDKTSKQILNTYFIISSLRVKCFSRKDESFPKIISLQEFILRAHKNRKCLKIVPYPMNRSKGDNRLILTSQYLPCHFFQL